MSVWVLILIGACLCGVTDPCGASESSGLDLETLFIAPDLYFDRPDIVAPIGGHASMPGTDAPVPLQPPNHAHFTKGDPIPAIRFSPVADAVKYQIELALTPDFSAASSMDLTEPDLDLGKYLTPDQWNPISFVLYWRVRAQNFDRTWTSWSEGWWFSKSILNAPEEVKPDTDARYSSDDNLPLLYWDEYTQTSTFDVELGGDPDFNDSWAFLRVTEPLLDFADLFNLQTLPIWYNLELKFYWRVYAVQGNGVQSPPSDARAIYKSTIDKPDLVDPEDHSKYPVDSSNLPNLTWEPVNDASLYHVQIVFGEDEFPDGHPDLVLASTNFNFADYISTAVWQDFYGQLSWRVSAVRNDGFYGSFSDEFDLVKIGRDRYMGYGDSITGGFGSEDFGTGFAGYPPILESMLQGAYGPQIRVLCEETYSWFPGGHTFTGDEYTPIAMGHHAPEHVLIMFGVVDLIDSGNPGCEDHDCHTIEHLTAIVNQVRSYHATPYVATLTPVNPESDRAYLQTKIDTVNAQIRTMCVQLSVPLADLDEAFEDTPLELPEYFYEHPDETPDWAHFNDAGYEIIANAWFDVLTR